MERGKEITANAFTHARKKLCPEVFVSLNDVLVESFYHTAPWTSKTGIRRILAVDGSRLELPNNTEVVEAFERANKQPDAKPLGIVSALFDVVNKVVLDSSINPANASENHLAFYHLGKVRHGDLVILDRGYKCLWLMLGIVQKGADYLIRLPVNAFKGVELFKKTEGRKYEYQENRTSALSFVKEGLIALFTGVSLIQVLTHLKEKIIKNILPIRIASKICFCDNI